MLLFFFFSKLKGLPWNIKKEIIIHLLSKSICYVKILSLLPSILDGSAESAKPMLTCMSVSIFMKL